MNDEDNMPDDAPLFRRKSVRSQLPKPSLQLYFVLLTDKLAKNIIQSPVKIGLVLCVFTMSLLLIYWSLFIRMSSLDEALLGADQLVDLQSQLVDLKTHWSESEIKEIEDSIAKAQAKIFDDFPSLANWLIKKHRFAEDLGLDMSYNMRQQKLTDLEKTLSLPLEITLKVKPGATDKVYMRTQKFIRSLVDENLHLEIAGNEIRSDGKNIQQVTLDMNVWVRGSTKISRVVQSDTDEMFEMNADVPFIQ